MRLEAESHVRGSGERLDVRGRRRATRLPVRQWKTLAGVQVKDGYELVIQGQFPADRLSLEIAQDNYLLVAKVFSRPEDEGAWRPWGQRTFYRVAVEDAAAVA